MQTAQRIWVPGARSGAKFTGVFDVKCLSPFADPDKLLWQLQKELKDIPNTARMLKQVQKPVPVSWVKHGLRLDHFDPEKLAVFQSLISEKWHAVAENLVVNVGLQHILDVVFAGDESAHANIDPWYVGLTAADPSPAAADTMASHAGWTEFGLRRMDVTAGMGRSAQRPVDGQLGEQGELYDQPRQLQHRRGVSQLG